MRTHTRYGVREDTAELAQEVRRIALPLDDASDLDPLLERIGEARYVLLGEASHGTHEYYTWRAEMSKRLIQEKGFHFIAVEGDWPDCYRVNCYVKGADQFGSSARQVLRGFDRWPTWMWANREIVQLAEWLRQYNRDLPEERKAGFYGLDVYSLWDSLRAVLEYLNEVDPSAVPAAQRAFRCFEPYGEDVQEYAWSTIMVPSSCEREVVELLARVRQKAGEYAHADVPSPREAHFNAEQNALVARNAERYYRTMVRGGSTSWNVRDHHMVETLNRLMQHHGPDAKAIVWEHNTHIGDARATDMARAGMVNVGQIVRELHGFQEAVLIGFASHRGSVIAGEAWGAPMQRMPVPAAQDGSWEDVFHTAGARGQMVIFGSADHGAPRSLWGRKGERVPASFYQTRGHRAIGVVYNPEHELFGNYVPTVLPERYDALLFIDESRALHPLHMPVREDEEAPETFPTGV